MNDIHEELLDKGFIQVEDNYILFMTFGEVILKAEKQLGDRYRFRDYIIHTESEKLEGKIYTNNPESFSLTLNRLLRRFYNIDVQEIEQKVLINI